MLSRHLRDALSPIVADLVRPLIRTVTLRCSHYRTTNPNRAWISLTPVLQAVPKPGADTVTFNDGPIVGAALEVGSHGFAIHRRLR
ncbi:hypothetical protein JOF41_007353 [Saccharothrix coeruleofusca]|uniref:hypothetical protein n=1 Tax=Saccharothrix coeruleofusca TaxID=33919 RepID=UPI001AE43125|nr:hypothetical protein [Saccharothrix coeruleofusca]MBP2341099.1 hypothetical protein [Saccharothrix coeruleofusca]